MSSNKPIIYDIEPHYTADGLSPFIIKLKFKSGTEVDLTGCTALMQMRVPDYRNKGSVVWEFSTDATDPEKLFVLGENGEVQFPRINKWKLDDNNYSYDLRITDTNGFQKTFLVGIFSVNQDISRR